MSTRRAADAAHPSADPWRDPWHRGFLLLRTPFSVAAVILGLDLVVGVLLGRRPQLGGDAVASAPGLSRLASGRRATRTAAAAGWVR